MLSISALLRLWQVHINNKLIFYKKYQTLYCTQLYTHAYFTDVAVYNYVGDRVVVVVVVVVGGGGGGGGVSGDGGVSGVVVGGDGGGGGYKC